MLSDLITVAGTRRALWITPAARNNAICIRLPSGRFNEMFLISAYTNSQSMSYTHQVIVVARFIGCHSSRHTPYAVTLHDDKRGIRIDRMMKNQTED